ncbi:MAG: GlsB/YeaQ/YmgE family stress response membrane protein [Dehalococcoidia bacterium]|nr:GlsB/YeaQ/YmgE family stress response membrane protein [Dehalococcoidia bacterium]
MLLINILLWILIGAVAGWLAGIIMRSRGSFIRNLILGIAGALLGGWIVSFFADVTTFSVLGFLVAIGGACLIIFLFRLLFGGRKK